MPSGLPAYDAALERAADVLRDLVLEDASQRRRRHRGADAQAGCVARRLFGLGIEDKRLLLDLFTNSAADFLGRWFESDVVKGAFAFDGIVGAYAAPLDARHGLRAAAPLLRRGERQAGRWGHAIGGMGAITQAMAKSAAVRAAP